MTDVGVPASWLAYVAGVDAALDRVGVPPDIRLGICQDIEEHLRNLMEDVHDAKPEDLPALLDPPSAYAEAYMEAMEAVAEEDAAPVASGRRRRECQSLHGEDGKRRLHICGRCFKVFYGCEAYETHVCSGEGPHEPPYWSHGERWRLTAYLVAPFMVFFLLAFPQWFFPPECGGGRIPLHDALQTGYFGELGESVAAYAKRFGRKPESIRELGEAAPVPPPPWYDQNGVQPWIMPGDVHYMGREGGFPVESVYYIRDNRDGSAVFPLLVYSHRPRKVRWICYTVLFSNGTARHYPSLETFLKDWEEIQ